VCHREPLRGANEGALGTSIADATVVVTGHAFLGRDITEELRRHGAKVFAVGSGHYDLRRRLLPAGLVRFGGLRAGHR
jgi:NAD(P)-dependent dehydrogenase (short-subunit alcohol dehydrogenase family)